MTKQNQDASDSAVAVQAGGDVTISQGMSPDDVTRMLGAIAQLTAASYPAIQSMIEARIALLEEKLEAKFNDPKQASTAAFNDPDFHAALRIGYAGAARSSDAAVTDTLVDLIARRSLEEKRSRLSLSLNDAIERAARLTENEFAALSLVFILSRTLWGVVDLNGFNQRLRTDVIPLVPHISRLQSSYEYLVTHSCATIQITSIDLQAILHNGYGGLFSKGFEEAQIAPLLPSENVATFRHVLPIMPCLNNPSRLQFAARTKDVLRQKIDAEIVSDTKLDELWNMFQSTFMSKAEIVELIAPNVPGVRELVDIWEQTPLQNLHLTSAGIAIGFSNLRRLNPNFDANLSIWIA